MAWKPCNYNGACANGFLVLADNLDMIVVKSSHTSGNMSFGGGEGWILSPVHQNLLGT